MNGWPSLREIVGGFQKRRTVGGFVNFLDALRKAIYAENVAYLSLPNGSSRHGSSIVLPTYSDEWVDRYVTRDYVEIDPVIARGMSAATPFDWDSLREVKSSAKWFFNEAERYGVGRKGITIPIRGRAGERAIFSITSFHSIREWETVRWRYQGLASALAPYAHEQAFFVSGCRDEPEAWHLSARQQRCLELHGRGLTPKMIGGQLGITATMVREHLHAARRKLGCLTIAAATAKAAMLEIIQI